MVNMDRIANKGKSKSKSGKSNTEKTVFNDLNNLYKERTIADKRLKKANGARMNALDVINSSHEIAKDIDFKNSVIADKWIKRNPVKAFRLKLTNKIPKSRKK